MNQKTNQQEQKYFLYPLNSLLAFDLSQKLKQNNKCQIVGQIDPQDPTECTPLADKIIEENFTQSDLEILYLDIDIFIIEIFKANYEQVEKILEFLQSKSFDKTKKVIFISHPLLWYISRKQIIDNLAQSEIFQDDMQELSEEQKQNIYRQSISFNDDDFNLRQTLPCYEKYRLLENQLISLGRQSSSIKTVVLLPGIIYGKGEDDFYQIFENCLGAEYLQLYMEGKNIIPVTYVENCSIALNILIDQDEFDQEFYIYNEEYEITQENLMLKIQENFQIETLKKNNDYTVMLKDDYLIRTLNIILENSKIFCQNKIESINHLGQKNESGNLDMNKQFIQERDILNNFKLIFEQFIEYRGIKRTKGIIFGLQESLQFNKIFETLSENFEINVYDPYEMIMQLKDKNLKDQPSLQNIYNQLLEYEQQKIQEIFEEQLEKQQKSKKKNQEELTKDQIEFDAFKNPPITIIIQLLVYYLKQPLQIFKGYILKNFPQDNNQAHLFLTSLHENDLRDDFDFILKIIPDSQLMQEGLKNHQKLGQKDPSMQLTDDKINFYERFMNWEDEYEILTEYLLKNNYQIKEIKFKQIELNTQKILDNLLDDDFNFSENHFEVQLEDEINLSQELIVSQEEIKDQQNQTQQQSKDLIDDTIQNQQSKQDINQENKENIIENSKSQFKEYIEASKKVELQRLVIQQEKILQEKTIALKQYLADIILPDITEGIIEICKEKPEDPIQYLINFLKEKQQS